MKRKNLFIEILITVVGSIVLAILILTTFFIKTNATIVWKNGIVGDDTNTTKTSESEVDIEEHELDEKNVDHEYYLNVYENEGDTENNINGVLGADRNQE